MPCHFSPHRIELLQRLLTANVFPSRYLGGCLIAVATLCGVASAESPVADGRSVKLKDTGKQVTVTLGGEPFTEFDYSDYNKPILYPIYGPGQVGMTRNWPMKDDVEGEAHDHPHHKSMWISHEISGVDFWGESEGKVITEKVETDFSGNPKPSNVLRGDFGVANQGRRQTAAHGSNHLLVRWDKQKSMD